MNFVQGTKPQDLLIAILFACILWGAVIWLSLKQTEVVHCAAMILIALCIVAVTVGLPVLVAFLLFRQLQDWAHWSQLRYAYRPQNKPPIDFDRAIAVFAGAQSKCELPVRIALDTTALYLSPDLSVSKEELAAILKPVASPSADSIGLAAALLLSLPLCLPLLTFWLAFRPIQIPWARVKSVGQREDGIDLEVDDTTLQIKSPSKIFQSIQQKLPLEKIIKTQIHAAE